VISWYGHNTWRLIDKKAKANEKEKSNPAADNLVNVTVSRN
jgi:hypothetical protein